MLAPTGKQPPAEFVEFWSQNYGLAVDVQLTDVKGNQWNVDRVLHLDARDELTDKNLSRRNGGLEQLDYSVEYLESMLSNWEDHSQIIPFAGINTQQSDQFNMVTLDYTESTEPGVSVWLHEESFGREEPFLIMISPDVKDFILQWRNN